MGTKCFIAIGVFSIELLACQVSTLCTTKIGKDSSIYIHDVKLGGVNNVISHLICIFYTFFKLKYPQN